MVALGTFGIEGFFLSFYASCHFYTFDAKDKQMAIEHNITHSYMFSSEFEDVVITGASSVSFSVAFEDKIIFSSSFVADANGVVRIFDISTLLSTYISDVYADFVFRINGQDTPVRVFHSNAPVPESAHLFLTSFFLSSAMHKKRTAHNRREVLSFYAFEACDVYVEAYYYNKSLVSHRYPLIAAADLAVDDVTAIDVSPMKFVDYSLGELLFYKVVAGRRNFTFELNDFPAAEPAVIFKNNFGVWETMYFVGTRESTPEIKRSLAYINGEYSMYDIDEQHLYKVKTGVLLGGNLSIAEDLARSKCVFLLDSHGEATDKIVFTDSDTKYTNNNDELPAFVFTYRRSRRNSSLVAVVRPPKLFDRTFDRTFD